MSINVTVSGNPVSIRRGRMVLSDLDQIKKNERDRRRRLRLEQVREQSKEISNRLRERAKNITKEQLTRLEKDGKSELKQMHDRKILELQRKYQEDMEDIGRAHVSASMQPNVEAMLEADRKRHRYIAAERGKEAVQRLRDVSQVEDPHNIQQERLRQVREMENARASMVANLPKRPSPKRQTEQDSDTSGDEVEKSMGQRESSLKKKRGRKQMKKKSPTKVVVKSPNVKVVVSQQKQRTRDEPQPGPSGMPAQRQPVVTDISDLPRTIICCESDDQEPRRSHPTSNSPSKADKVARYNPEDYKQTSASSSVSSSSSLSDDSSYFSDGAGDQGGSKNTPRHHTSLAGSKVQLYDHNTRQRNAYNRPVGIVERVDIRGEPNAEDVAREVLQSESAESRLVESRKSNARRRGNDALLRERVRRDYQTLMQNMDHLSREERKLRAVQIHGPPDIHMGQARRQEVHAKRQRDMDHAFETILQNSSSDPQGNVVNRPPERIITITPRDLEQDTENAPGGVWREPPFFERLEDAEDPQEDKENELSREEQILEMLKKVERQKRLLLKEFGANLPDEILNASLNPLFNKNPPEYSSEQPPCRSRQSPPCEIKVVNMSSCDECDKRKTTKIKKKGPVQAKKIEIAVQTSSLDEMGAAAHKAVQVELINGKPSSSSSTSQEAVERPECCSDEHREQIIIPESSSGSSDSVISGVVIDIDKTQVKVTPKKRKSSLKVSRRSSPRIVVKPRSMPVSKAASPVKRTSKSAPASRQVSPKKTVSETERVKTPRKKVKIQLDKGRVKVRIVPPKAAEVSKDTSSSSPEYLTPDTFDAPSDKSYKTFAPPSTKRQVKIRRSSDTSSSYTSPPLTISGPRHFMANSTPVLEILAESENEMAARHDVSPVSSPGTPSPRTIALPTNTPHTRRINKVLQFTNSTDSHLETNSMEFLLPSQQSTPQEPANYQQKRPVSPEVPKKQDVCTCENPSCKLMHAKIEDIQEYALKNCPEILKKYEDLQNMCTERIASLTDLIEKVRSEQKGMELSVVTQSDESTILQFPGPTPMRNDIQSVRRLVDSIEAIHNQLAKTLCESQKIIANDGAMKSGSSDVPMPSMSGESSTRSKEWEDTATTGSSMENDVGRGKPSVLSDVPVNLPADHLNALRRPQTNVRVSFTDPPPSPVSGTSPPRMDEDMVRLLSKEILEQSKALENSVGQDSMKDSTHSSVRTPTPEATFSSPRKQARLSPQNQGNDSPPRRDCNGVCCQTRENAPDSPEGAQTKKDDFVPLLAGIPRVQRTPPGSYSENNKPRPPVALSYGPFRQEIRSPGHELSTIVEFDTPDTANRSQGSIRSPVGRSRKNLTPTYQNTSVQPVTSPECSAECPKSPRKKQVSPSRKLPSSPQQRSTQSSARKPPERDLTSPPRRSTQTPARKSPPQHAGQSQIKRTNDRKTTSEMSTTPSSPEKPKASANNDAEPRKDASAESNSSLPDISAEMKKRNLVYHVQVADQSRQGPFRNKAQPQPLQAAPVSMDLQKEKTTSTSSNSFSGLSGISEISSTPTSDVLKYASSPEEMEAALKKLGLGWAITTLKKTREASALSSSSNSDMTPVNTARKLISPVKKQQLETNVSGLPDLSDVSSISMKDASKSTERAVLLKGRTSTPNIENSNTSTEKSSTSTTNSSRASLQEPSDSLTAPNVSLSSMKKSYMKHRQGP